MVQICSRYNSVNANHHFNTPYYVPSSVRRQLTGINTESALSDNIAASALQLTQDDLARLDALHQDGQ